MVAPTDQGITGVLDEHDLLEPTLTVEDVWKKPDKSYKIVIVWKNVIMLAVLNIASIYGLYLFLFKAMWSTIIWITVIRNLAGLGVSAGAHRLWTHRSYKAKLPLRIILMIFYSIAGQYSLYVWVRDHRTHHKYSETNADPHNANRGFFFSHMGWLMVKRHPDVIAKGKDLDLSDLEADEVVKFQKKHHTWIVPLLCFVFPITVPVYFFGESWHNAIYVCTIFTYCASLHITWLVNSVAHMKGYRPYDRYIGPVENIIVSILTHGEGWHNYHHVFPWDYKTSEFGFYWVNMTAGFIDLCAKLGLAYDLKYANPEIVKKRVGKTGDRTHHLWGFGDQDLTKEDFDCTINTDHIS